MNNLALVVIICFVLLLFSDLIKKENQGVSNEVSEISLSCMKNDEFAENYKNYAMTNGDKNTLYYKQMAELCKPLKSYVVKQQKLREEQSKKNEETINKLIKLVLFVITILIIPMALWFVKGLLDKRANG